VKNSIIITVKTSCRVGSL